MMSRRKHLRITGAILALGLLAAMIVRITATPEAEERFADDPLAEKKYHRDLERMGGKGSLVAAELQEWFASRWSGPALGGTIAVITVVTAWGYWFVAGGTRGEAGRPAAPRRPE